VVCALWLRCNKCRVSRGISFFAWNVTKHDRRARSETKCIVVHHDQATHPLLTIEHSIFSVMAGFIVEILFILFSAV